METKINSFETACDFMGYQHTRPNIEGLPPHLGNPLVADYEMSVINEALTKEALEKEKEKIIFPDYRNWNQKKCFPIFEVKADDENPSGFGLSYDGYDYGRTDTSVGSRFCLPNPELVKYSASQFAALHTMRMIGK